MRGDRLGTMWPCIVFSYIFYDFNGNYNLYNIKRETFYLTEMMRMFLRTCPTIFLTYAICLFRDIKYSVLILV